MVNRFYNLPSLTMLNTFETAARLGSFKLASSELNVTPGAVSHQIRRLEEAVGQQLFQREHRMVFLTASGQSLYEALERSYIDISAALSHLRQEAELQTVSVGSTTAVSSLWLTPRLTNFWREHGEINVSQEISDRRFAATSALDMRIEYRESPPDGDAVLLFNDQLTPVCSPEFLDGRSNLTPEELAQTRLVHMDAPSENWTTWESWFSKAGFKGGLRSGQRVNNYSIALQIAREAGGVVLGWQQLISPLLKDGVLVQCCDIVLPAPGAFYLVGGRHARKPEVALFREWLLAHSG